MNYLGIDKTILDVTTSPSSKEEKVMNRVFPFALGKLSNDWDWPWLRKRVVLTEDTDADIEGYQYIYDIPSGIGKVLRIESTSYSARNASEVFRHAFIHDYDIDGGDVKLACDIANAEMLYSQALTTLNDSPGADASHVFSEAVAGELAAQAAMPLTSNSQKRGEAEAYAKHKAEVAWCAEMNSNEQSDDWPESDFIAVRRWRY